MTVWSIYRRAIISLAFFLFFFFSFLFFVCACVFGDSNHFNFCFVVVLGFFWKGGEGGCSVQTNPHTLRHLPVLSCLFVWFLILTLAWFKLLTFVSALFFCNITSCLPYTYIYVCNDVIFHCTGDFAVISSNCLCRLLTVGGSEVMLPCSDSSLTLPQPLCLQ